MSMQLEAREENTHCVTAIFTYVHTFLSIKNDSPCKILFVNFRYSDVFLRILAFPYNAKKYSSLLSSFFLLTPVNIPLPLFFLA
jgi:hypothetical protein